jgi:DNA replication factor GINS
VTADTVIRVNIDELQSVRDRERQTDKPQQLRESFYTDVGAFVEQLRAERDRAAERHDSPYADEVMQLTDEIDATQQLVEDIHERRIGKVVKAASLEAAELSPEVTGLTAEERDLFEQLVSDIEHHRQDVLAAVEGTGNDSTADDHETGSGPVADASEVTAADLMGPDSATPDDGQQTESASTQQHRESRTAHPEPEDLPPDTTGDTDATGDTARGETTHRSADTPDGPDRRQQQTGPDSTTGDRAPAAETDGGNETTGATPAPNGSHERDSQPGARQTSDANPGQSAPTGPDGSGRGQSTAAGERNAQTQQPGSPDARSADAAQSTSSGEDREQNTPAVGGKVERERVLVTESVATFVGSDDRDYDLAAEDVVTLPSTNADILVERDAARRL